jgi:hypothetical protein
VHKLGDLTQLSSKAFLCRETEREESNRERGVEKIRERERVVL